MASALAEPALGIAADVWRGRALVAASGAVYALALLMLAGSTGFAVAALAFTVLYPASGGFVSLAQATLMDAEPASREQNMLRWTLAGAVGALAGPAAVAAFVGLALGWRPLFALFALAAAALALACIWMPSPPAQGGGLRDGLSGAWRALRRPAVVRWLVLLETSDLLLDVLRGFLALYLVDESGLRPASAALVVTAVVGADLVGNVAALRLLPRTNGRRYLRTSALPAAALFIGFLLMPAVAAKVACLVALAAVTAGWYPLQKAALYAELPGRSGTAMALSAATAPLAALPPLVVGVLAENVGLGTALWTLLLAPVALLVLLPRGHATGSTATG